MSTQVNHKDSQRLKKARTDWMQGRAEDAIQLYQKLVAKYPHQQSMVVELAQCYATRNQFEQADVLLRRLMGLHSANGPVMALVGRTYKKLGRGDLELQANQLAIKTDLPLEAEIQVRTSIAAACERKNDLEEAQVQVDCLLQLDPQSPTTLLVAGILDARRESWTVAESQLRTAFESDLPPLLKSRSGYELANVLDKQHRYAEAVESLTAAKQIALPRKQEALKKSKWVAGLTTRLENSIRPHHFEDWATVAKTEADKLESHRRICLITGHPRSGTTLLEQMLDCHPNVSSADESSSLLNSLFTPLVGESAIVPTPSQLLLGSISQHQIDAGRAAYIRSLESRLQGDSSDTTNGDRWLIDKNPEAVVMLPVLQRSISDARVIVVLRDPRDVCLSCFMQFLPATPASVNFDNLENAANKYARTMKLWLTMRRHLKLDWCEVRYEDLVTDPVGQSRRVLEFLDLEFDDRVLQFAKHVKTKIVRSPSYHAVAKPIYQSSMGRWRNYETEFVEACKILQPFIDAFGYSGD